MKKIKYFSIALLIISCNKDEIVEVKDTLQIENKIEVQDGVLSFSSKDFLNTTIKDLKQVSD